MSRYPVLHQNITTDNLFTALFNFDHLRFKAGCEKIKPNGHVHSFFPNALDGSIKCRTVPIVVFTDGKQALEVVSGLVEAKGQQQPGNTSVAVQKWVDMNQLELGNATG